MENKLALFDLDFFSEELLDALACGGESYRTEPVHFIWQRLVESRIIIKVFAHMPGAFIDHRIDRLLLSEHLHGDIFPNLFAPPSGLAERYRGAVVAIDVVKDGDERRGSGFLVQLEQGGYALVTCRHNVDPAEGISLNQITTAAGQPPSVGTPILSPDYVLSSLRVTNP